ncbi:hypothetical protein STTU_2769 [Streptomyces sp. Tu6071]|nr:hypothetical protein STTU_2769 [Streptomyces sp. Tu6071]
MSLRGPSGVGAGESGMSPRGSVGPRRATTVGGRRGVPAGPVRGGGAWGIRWGVEGRAAARECSVRPRLEPDAPFAVPFRAICSPVRSKTAQGGASEGARAPTVAG